MKRSIPALQRRCHHGLAVVVAVACGQFVGVVAGAEPGASVSAAFQVPFVSGRTLQAEGNPQINDAKQRLRDPGGALHLALRNHGPEALSVTDVVWDGGGLESHRADFGLIWYRLQPDPLPPDSEGVLTLCLRRALATDTEVTLRCTDGRSLSVTVPALPPPCTIEAVRFTAGRARAFVYLRVPAGMRAADVRLYWNGQNATRRTRWLSRRPSAGVLIAAVSFQEPLARGALQQVRVQAGDGTVATAVRAFDRLAAFGSCGGSDVERYAFNGLTASHSFGPSSPELLDRAGALGIRCAVTTGPTPRQDILGHPALYAYILTDEPDCQDYGVEDRPMEKRIGAHAPEMLRFANECMRQDPATPTMLTVDLTFTPANYFVYGGLADLTNPDCYTVTCGWPVHVLPEYLDTVRQACAPRPFTFTYQGCWEEVARRLERDYVGGQELRDKGFAAFKDVEKTRGFGRPPHPAEVVTSMLYGVGCGASGLFSYIDSSELCGTLMFHGSEDLPELWDAIGRTSRTLHRVAPLLELSHVIEWAVAETPDLWVRTLIAGDQGLLVVAINKRSESTATGFVVRPLENATLRCPEVPWFAANCLLRVAAGAWQPVRQERQGTTLVWHDTIAEGALYLLASTATVERLEQQDMADATARARAIVSLRQTALERQAVERNLQRTLFAAPSESRLLGTAVHGYGVQDPALWNPQGASHAGIEFWERSGTTSMGVNWTAQVPAAQAHTPLSFVWQGRLYGGTVSLTVTNAAGQTLRTETVKDCATLASRQAEITFPAAGAYTISLQVAPTTPREHGGRVAGMAFLVSPAASAAAR
jgi:hypothetical protein